MANALCRSRHIFPNVEWAAVTKQTQQRESGRHQWVYYQFPVIQDSYTIHKSNSLLPNTLLSDTQLDKCVFVHIRTYICVYRYMIVYIYTYINIYMHIYLHTHSFHFPLRPTLHHVGVVSTTALFDGHHSVNMPRVPRHCAGAAGAASSSLSDTSARFKIWHIVTDLQCLQSQIKG